MPFCETRKKSNLNSNDHCNVVSMKGKTVIHVWKNSSKGPSLAQDLCSKVTKQKGPYALFSTQDPADKALSRLITALGETK